MPSRGQNRRFSAVGGGNALSAIGLTTLTPFTRSAADAARRLLAEAGHDVYLFEADGVGGRALESAIHAGRLSAVLDLALCELAAELTGSVATAGPDRLTAASLGSIPQVVALGGLDLVMWGSLDSLPRMFPGRKWLETECGVVFRTTVEENDRLGKEIAFKLSAARGPAAVLVPQRGLSSLDSPGGPFWLPEANRALFQSLVSWIGPQVERVEIDAHLNDEAGTSAAVRLLLRMLKTERPPEKSEGQ
jgi:uncharacterized protein (UPF0261 family)